MKKSLYDWSGQEYSHLPWRKNRTLYKTLVSEIMLQQTNVSTVLKHFDRFLKVYPTVQDLAQSTEEEVCSHWQGLGYYRRARNLRKAAVAIVKEFAGDFPQDFNDLIKIPGIGAYTANALIAIGRDRPALALDANLERVFSRVYGIEIEKGPKLLKEIQSREFEILKDFKLSKYGARVINESLMDLGRVYCQAKKADCLLCPIREKCVVFQNKKDPLKYPFAQDVKKDFFDLSLLRVIVIKKKKVVGFEKDQKEWLSGQIEIPTFTLECSDSNFSQYPKANFKKIDSAKLLKTAITKYKISNYVVCLSEEEFNQFLKSNKLSDKRYQDFVLNPDKIHFSTATLKSFRVKSVI